MPYITTEWRKELDKVLVLLPQLNPGQLAYFITKLLLDTDPANYTDYALLVGVLETVKLELYRRAIVPYENEKKATHGDVY